MTSSFIYLSGREYNVCFTQKQPSILKTDKNIGGSPCLVFV